MTGHLMFVKPPSARHTQTEQAGGLAIRIPSRRNIFLFAFLSLWLCGWLAGEIAAPYAFFTAAHKEPGGAAFMLFWFCGWTVGGAFALYAWLWQLKGCQIITVSPDALSIRHELFGHGRTKHYDVSQIRHLRIAPLTYDPADYRSATAFWGFGGGAIAFDYGFRTFRFGAGVDEAEARIILETIVQRLPRLSEPANV